LARLNIICVVRRFVVGQLRLLICGRLRLILWWRIVFLMFQQPMGKTIFDNHFQQCMLLSATLSLYMNDKSGSITWEIWQNLADYLGVQGHEIFDVTPTDAKD
jgi:hypothetical protein